MLATAMTAKLVQSGDVLVTATDSEILFDRVLGYRVKGDTVAVGVMGTTVSRNGGVTRDDKVTFYDFTSDAVVFINRHPVAAPAKPKAKPRKATAK